MVQASLTHWCPVQTTPSPAHRQPHGRSGPPPARPNTANRKAKRSKEHPPPAVHLVLVPSPNAVHRSRFFGPFAPSRLAAVPSRATPAPKPSWRRETCSKPVGAQPIEPLASPSLALMPLPAHPDPHIRPCAPLETSTWQRFYAALPLDRCPHRQHHTWQCSAGLLPSP